MAQTFDQRIIADISTDSQFLVVVNEQGALELWQHDDAVNKPFRYMKTIANNVGSLATLSSSGQLLVAMTREGNIAVRDWASLFNNGVPEPIQTIVADSAVIDMLDVSLDDATIAARIGGQPYAFWTIANGKRIQFSAGVRNYTFNPQGGTLVMLTTQQGFIIDTQSGEVLRTLNRASTDRAASSNSYVDVAFTPNGQFLATISDFSEIVLWRLKDGAELQNLVLDTTVGLPTLRFSPDGRTLAVAYRDSVTLWRAQPPEE